MASRPALPHETPHASDLERALVDRAGWEGSPLVLEEERSVTPELETELGRLPWRRKRCPRPVMLWLAHTRDFARIGCDSWECPHCSRWKRRVLSRVLTMDAAIDPPSHCVTLTTSDPATPAAAYRQASAAVWKRVRRRYGPIDYLGNIEFTTGRGKRSGGHRRMHGHYLLKPRGWQPDDELELLVRETWQGITGAFVVEVAPLRLGEAAVSYFGLHHSKPAQRPPAGWRGMRLRASKGYWHRPITELRELAAAELHLEARAWRAGRTPLEQLAVELELERQRAVTEGVTPC